MTQDRAKPLELDLLCSELENTFSSKIEGVGNDAIAKKRNFLSKALSAFVLHKEAGATIDEAVLASIDGGLDHGIDSVFIDSNHIIWLIQSKYIDSGFGEPELGDVSKFRDGIVDLLRGELNRFNQSLNNRSQQIQNTLHDEICKVKAILVYSGTAISDDRRHIFSDIERSFNDSSPEFISCYAYGLNTLHELNAMALSTQSIDTEIELLNFGHVSRPYKAFYGQINAQKLVDLWNEHQHNLVEKNIRRFKGETSVNQSLSKTLENSPEHFFYFNNGITFLCDSIREIGSRDPNKQQGKFKVCGLSIINGAQTVGVLGSKSIEYYNDNPINIFATFLCLEQTPDNFSVEVTQARNRQNAVDLEDFASLDDSQISLKETLQLAGITYLIKQGNDDPPSCDACFSIRELVPFLACTVTGNEWQQYVISAKSNKKRLFRQIGLISHREKMQNAYTKLFPDSRTAKEIWRIVQLGRIISATVKSRANGEPFDSTVELQGKDILNEGVWLIMHIVFLKTKLQYGNELMISLAEKYELSEKIDCIYQKLVNVMQAKQWGKSAKSIFENQTDCNTVKNKLMAQLISI